MNLCRGDIPSFKLVDTEKTYAFLDIGPLSKGHALVIPKCEASALCDLIAGPRGLSGTVRTDTHTLAHTDESKHDMADHGEKITDVPDEHLTEVLKHCKAIASAAQLKDYNILQNNGKLAHQEVGHVHFQ